LLSVGVFKVVVWLSW